MPKSPARLTTNWEATRHWRERHPEYWQQYQHPDPTKRAEDLREAMRQWRKLYPEKILAHTAVRSAIRRGALARETCEVPGCGALGQAHHASYAPEDRLDVHFYCAQHHMEQHRKERA